MQNRNLVIAMFILLLVGKNAFGQNSKEELHFGNNKSIIYDIALIGSTRLAVAEGNIIKVYRLEDQTLLNELNGGHHSVILSLDVSSDSSKLISSGRDGIICLWDLNKGTLLTKFNYNHGEEVTTVKFSPNNKYILSGGTDNQIILYDAFQKKEVKRFTGHTDHILCVDFHPAGNIIASSSADKKVILWDINSGQRLATINSLKGWQREISFSTDSSKLISCGDRSNIYVWDVSNPKNIRLLNQLKEGKDWLLTKSLYQDKKTIVSGGMGGEVRIDHSFGVYTYKVKKPITKILFVPNESHHLKIIASTLGKGVIMVDAKNMKLHN